ncbi:MAG: type VI secretion system membrane subunit TssM [Gammaproteobacteria bacterium]|nr:type VI secretion system membrane subunit TssM [Gammaproteobacteria bacterium]
MKAVIQILTNRTVISVLALIAFSVIIWLGGPMLAVGETKILDSELARFATIAVLILIWGINNLRKQKEDEKKTEGLLAGGLLDKLTGGGKKGLSDAAAAEQEQINKRFREALAILRKAKLNKKAGGLRLHELPWYIVIGPPGSGKTTAIINSGLKFPLADHLGTQAVRGVGGTRDCDWWFTDEAVLIDTAGRYTTQDSNREADSAGWDSFLQQLRTYRKAKPINGAIVTISYADLVNNNDRERIEHAQRIRERIKELREKLGIDFPVYFFITKCDLISGFNEFFNPYSKKEREQVWGVTFPFEGDKAERKAYTAFASEFDQLLHRINSHVLSRMQNEKDITTRSRVLAFPQEMLALKPIATDFIRNVFQPTRLDTSAMLRGIYFTSGTQEGTPIDRVMGSLASTFGLDQQSVPSFSGQGRSYFLHDVLARVVFQEAGLGDTKRSYQVQMDLLAKGAYAASAFVLVGATLGWASSFSDSEQRVVEVKQFVDRYIEQYREINTSVSQPVDILPAVNSLSNALALLEEDREKWFVHGGLDPSGKLGDALEQAYHRVLKTLYQPGLGRFLEQQLVSNTIDSEVLFDVLKTYLMLSDLERLDSKTVNEWLTSIWPSYMPGEPESQQRLALHTSNLLKHDYEPMLLKPSYVERARERLNQVPLSERVYARLKQTVDAGKYDLKTADWWRVGNINVFRFRDQAEPIGVIPGFYTHQGFHKIFLSENAVVSQNTAEESWVLGARDDAALSESQQKELRDSVQKLYLRDYEATWRDLINSIEVVRFESLDHGVDVLNALASPASPLKSLLTVVETNVTLTRLPTVETKVAAVGKLVDAAQSAVQAAAKRNPNAPWRTVEVNFKPVASLADGGAAGVPPIDDTLVKISKVVETLQKVNAAPNLNEAGHKMAAQRVSSRGNDAIGRLRKHAQSMPSPVRNWVTSLSSESWRMLLNLSKEQIRENWNNDVWPEYERTVSRRYPFSQTSETDVSLDDFARFFGPNGTLDFFFKNNLEPFIATRGRSWREEPIEDLGLDVNRTLIINLQRAAQIRDAFFRKSPDTPSLELIMTPTKLDNKVSKVSLEVEGTRMNYSHGPTRAQTVNWPGNAASGRARVNFETTTGREYHLDKEGSWSLFRLMDEADVKSAGQYDKVKATFRAKNHSAEYEVRTKGVSNPLATDILHSFSLPREI